MDADREITNIKQETFDVLRKASRVWMIEENAKGEFVVHNWMGDDWRNGAGVGPQSTYPTLRKAAARLLQLLGTGAVAPQTWPENICIGTISTDAAES